MSAIATLSYYRTLQNPQLLLEKEAKDMLAKNFTNPTPLQQARQRYDKNFFKFTARLHPSFEAKLNSLVRIHGDRRSALEFAINRATSSLDLHRREVEQLSIRIDELEQENFELRTRLERFENAEKQEEDEEDLSSIVESAIASNRNPLLSQAIEQTFAQVDLDQVFETI